jgi:sugar lactone lactonase YvrE
MIKFLKSNNSLYVLERKPLLSNVFASLFFLSVMAILSGCVKGGDITSPITVPVITTNSFVANLASTTAQSGGIITSNGGGSIETVGVCYSSTNSTPTTSNSFTVDTLKSDAANTQTFTSNLTGLTPSTTYYLRTYATNSAGTAYGSVVKFTTSANLPSIITTVSTLAGSGSFGFTNGNGTGASFGNPQGVVADAAGNVYVADGFNNVIRKITPTGDVSTYAGDGNAGLTNGPAATAEFYAPQSLAIDAQGNIFVADIGNNVIREITAAGIVSTYAGRSGFYGYINESNPLLAQFNNPQGLCVDASENVYVADRVNNVIRKISSAGKVTRLAGYYGVGPGLYNTSVDSVALFNTPTSVAVDSKGNVYVADSKNSCIRKISSAGVSTLLGGSVQTTLIGTPVSVAVDSKDNLYIVDNGGRIIEFTTTNVVYILAGSTGTAGYKDGAGASAKFNNPQSVTVDKQGNIYVADEGNNVIRKIVTNVTNF